MKIVLVLLCVITLAAISAWVCIEYPAIVLSIVVFTAVFCGGLKLYDRIS